MMTLHDILDGFKYLSIYISSPVVLNSQKTLFFLFPECANLASFEGAAALPPVPAWIHYDPA